ncbi:alpha/beta hydrolase [Streptomyces sp. BI20]|uniref:alpha/beta hydrolase n=1 Tax=Streptomyces sp. BI20 TaxID=3403460 RepID=UPI003C731217
MRRRSRPMPIPPSARAVALATAALLAGGLLGPVAPALAAPTPHPSGTATPTPPPFVSPTPAPIPPAPARTAQPTDEPTEVPVEPPAPVPTGGELPPDESMLADAHQKIRWGDCPNRPKDPNLRCGTALVPLDHAHPDKGSIRLALLKIPATGPHRLGSLFLNFGGPGGQGTEGLAAARHQFIDLGESYDLIGFDPRGVGYSAPVSCGDDDLSVPPGADAAAQLAALRAYAKRCAEHSGPVLPHVGTVDVARDLDVLRQAVGDRKLNYLGFSYGTRLGAVYAALYPRNVGRMVLDGVDTLSEPLAEQALVSAAGQQQALDNFLGWCAKQTGCVLGTNSRTARTRLDALVRRMDAEPLVGDDGTLFTGGDVIGAIGTALYSRTAWPILAEALNLASRDHDPSGLLQLGGGAPDPQDPDSGAVGGPVPVPADNFRAALNAVNCADDPDRSLDKATPQVVEREIDALEPLFERASPLFGRTQLATVLACYGRPAGTDFIRDIQPPKGLPRLLLVGTRGDPATPYRWTEETARRLGPSATILDYKGDGHGAYAVSRCVRAEVDTFLVEGRLPRGTRSCGANE